jgi:hypothetical protein
MGPATIALKHGEAALTAIPKFHKFAFVLFVRNETRRVMLFAIVIGRAARRWAKGDQHADLHHSYSSGGADEQPSRFPAGR